LGQLDAPHTRILKFGILRVPPIQVPPKKGKNLEFFFNQTR
jgi:hypothetical protein